MNEEIKKKNKKWIWLFILIVIVVLLVLWQQDKLALGGFDSYQAVFLTNNQVYFGKLSRADSKYPVLKEVYYLQVTQALQPRGQEETPTQNVSLVKLGGELHGPEDEMVINRDHILFYEDLKPDSQVVQAIKQFKEGQQ